MTACSQSPDRPAITRTFTVLVAAILLWLAGQTAADGQRTTEQFIPVGRSPGLSGVVTYLGEIVAVDPGARSLNMRRPGDTGAVTITVAPDTRIWVDRSSLGLPNVTGGFGDLTAGGIAEVHFRDPEERRTAVWIKLQARGPG